MLNSEYDSWKLMTPEEDRSNYDEDIDKDGDAMDRGYEKIKDNRDDIKSEEVK